MKKILNPLLWENGKLKNEVRKKLLEIADFFIEYAEIPRKFIKDVLLVGSNASYNYKDTSDIDIHVVIGPEGKEDFIECLTKLLDSKRKLFNNEYEIEIYGHDVEVYPQLEDEQLVSAGIYSITKNKWLKRPERTKPDFNDASMKAKYEKYVHIIGKIIDSGCKDYKSIKKLFSKLKKIRKKSLDKRGEYSVENIVYKKLRDEKILDKLIACMRKAKSKQLSLENILS